MPLGTWTVKRKKQETEMRMKELLAGAALVVALSSVAYAQTAPNAGCTPRLASGAEGTTKLASGAEGTTKLASGASPCP